MRSRFQFSLGCSVKLHTHICAVKVKETHLFVLVGPTQHNICVSMKTERPAWLCSLLALKTSIGRFLKRQKWT